jgi:hypothetical protein
MRLIYIGHVQFQIDQRASEDSRIGKTDILSLLQSPNETMGEPFTTILGAAYGSIYSTY